mmetsp:Transcript_74799/g.206233  ORF Transcript_74799/g.206233 Transcript_74799/m.206233 type:complete len:211 (-) Transcript_74799:53-685(-)
MDPGMPLLRCPRDRIGARNRDGDAPGWTGGMEGGPRGLGGPQFPRQGRPLAGVPAGRGHRRRPQAAPGQRGGPRRLWRRAPALHTGCLRPRLWQPGPRGVRFPAAAAREVVARGRRGRARGEGQEPPHQQGLRQQDIHHEVHREEGRPALLPRTVPGTQERAHLPPRRARPLWPRAPGARGHLQRAYAVKGCTWLSSLRPELPGRISSLS